MRGVVLTGILSIAVGMLSTYGRGLLAARRPSTIAAGLEAVANATVGVTTSASASLSGTPLPSAAVELWQQPSLPTVPHSFRLVRTWPHDASAFTQGLQWWGSTLYEGTGLNGQSRLRTVALSDANGYTVTQEVRIGDQYFGEGIVVWTDTDGAHGVGAGAPVLLQLTWQNNAMFLYDATTLTLLRTMPLAGTAREGGRGLSDWIWGVSLSVSQ